MGIHECMWWRTLVTIDTSKPSENGEGVNVGVWGANSPFPALNERFLWARLRRET